MPKLLKLVSLRETIKGGSTNPILIEAQDEKGLRSFYVLKLFKKKDINQIYSVAKEIIGAETALQFDLPIPDYGVINFDHEELKGFYSEDYISELDTGYKFCSEYNEGTIIYDQNGKNTFFNNYDMENLFGFDNIILNTDRGGFRNKANLLVEDDRFLLIDHELILSYYTFDNLDLEINFKSRFNSYYYSNHIFYNILRKKKKNNPIFEETRMHLANFDISKIDSIFAQFDKFNIAYGNKDICYSYFKWLKENNNYVFDTLNKRIS